MDIKLRETNRRGLTILLVFTFFMVVGFEMIMPLIVGHYVNVIGFSATAVATALATRRFTQQGLALVGGTLADHVNVRTLISSGVLLRSIGFIVLAFSYNFLLLMVSMILIGLGGVLFEMPYQTAIATLTNDGNRSKYYSLNNTIVGIASTIGPLLGALLLYLDFKLVCFGAALCFMITFIISTFAMPQIIRKSNSYTVVRSIKTISKDKAFLKFTFFMIIFWFAASQIDISFPLKIQEISGSADKVGVMYAVYALITATLQYPLVSLLLKKYLPRQIVVIGISLITVALLLMAFVNTTGIFLLIVALFALGMLLARPNQQNVAVTMADQQALGMYLGFNSLGTAVGCGVGTIIGGAFFDLTKATGMNTLPWVLFSIISAFAMLGFMMCKSLGKARNSKIEISEQL